MSATIPESMRLNDLLKATGYDCPVDLQGKTFDQATEGGGADLEDNKTVSITENGVVEITPSEGKDGMKKVTATVNVSGGGSGNILYAWYNEFSSQDGDKWKRYLYTDKENLVNGENVNCLVINASYNIKILKKNCIFQQAFSDDKVPYPCLKIGSKFYKTNGSSLPNDCVETTCPIPSSEYIYRNAIKVVEVEGVTYYVDTENNVIETGSMIAIGRGGNENEIYTYLKNGTTVSDTSIVDIINNKIINKEYEEPILTSYLSGATHYGYIALYYFLDPLSYFFNDPISYIRDNESDVE